MSNRVVFLAIGVLVVCRPVLLLWSCCRLPACDFAALLLLLFTFLLFVTSTGNVLLLLCFLLLGCWLLVVLCCLFALVLLLLCSLSGPQVISLARCGHRVLGGARMVDVSMVAFPAPLVSLSCLLRPLLV